MMRLLHMNERVRFARADDGDGDDDDDEWRSENRLQFDPQLV